MKKFCSKCGHQLDLGKKLCTECQAFNPYFIAGFTTTTRVEPLAKIEVEPELPVVKEDTKAFEEVQADRLERERIELNVKNELLRVKEETELYKKETLDLVKGVHKELEDIDNENKLLKEKVRALKSRQVEEAAMITTAPPVPKGSMRTFIVVGVVVLVVLTAGLAYYTSDKKDDKATITPAGNEQVKPTPAVVTQSDKKTSPAIVTTAVDTTSTHKLLAVATPVSTHPVSAAPTTPAPVAAKPASVPFSLSAARATGDLVGKRLSGCDVTINSVSEIEHLDNLVLVEKLATSYLKYKCTVKVKQGNETFTSSPYIYYSPEGAFIKVDGTNCE